MKPSVIVVAGITLLVLSAGGMTAASELVNLGEDGRTVVVDLQSGTDPADGTREDGESGQQRDGNATVWDADGDGVTDWQEVDRYGTDPTKADTDGDGFTDGEEIYLEETLPNADPTRVDVYVEVDYMIEPGLTDAEIAKLERTFAEAPVENPDGSEGISLHVRMDEAVPTESTVALSAEHPGETDLDSYADSYFDHRNQGYRYALIAEEVTLDGESVGGAAFVGKDSFLIHQYRFRDNLTGSTFLHELGHSLGLSHHPDGPKTHSFEEYPSTMNYNKPNDYYGYSAGESSTEDIDEWATVRDEIPNTVPETSDLPDPRQVADSPQLSTNTTGE